MTSPHKDTGFRVKKCSSSITVPGTPETCRWHVLGVTLYPEEGSGGAFWRFEPGSARNMEIQMNLTHLKQVLEAREVRARKQCGLLSRGGVLVSFGLNIPGPVKNAVLYRMVFEEGMNLLCRIPGLENALTECGESAAGPFAFFLIRGDSEQDNTDDTEEDRRRAEELKAQLMCLEEDSALGRLFDIDVLYKGTDGSPEKISRTVLGTAPRKCLVCSDKAFVCVRAARHSVPEVLMKVVGLILSSEQIRRRLFQTETMTPAEDIALEAVKAILYEVITTPKPGLVDAENNGAHKDMDITTFFDSAVAIAPYLRDCVQTGMEHAYEPEEELLPVLRPPGIRAEGKMYRATGGVNTHKGVVFTLGLFCAAAGIDSVRRKQRPGTGTTAGGAENARFDTIPKLAGKIASSMENGTRGIRNEAMGGYPSLRETLEEVYGGAADRKLPQTGREYNRTGVRILLELMSRVDDSNAVRRKGEEAARSVRERAKTVLKDLPGTEEDSIRKPDADELLMRAAVLDRELTAENISPGGSADLLAAAYFLLLLYGTVAKENNA